jgi:hypothetical protein
MSDSIPKPLASINALRAHLKLLERGVNDARTKRVGPPPAAAAPLQPRREQPRPVAPQASQGFQIPARTDNGKPKAKARSGGDFSEFFGSIEKRAAS